MSDNVGNLIVRIEANLSKFNADTKELQRRSNFLGRFIRNLAKVLVSK